ncbi:MAG: tetratricopeptide repeat protein [Endomicrobiales bacterium]|nr:tetratricopeptide repeat protein [Endomicrobiales bacterium]
MFIKKHKTVMFWFLAVLVTSFVLYPLFVDAESQSKEKPRIREAFELFEKGEHQEAVDILKEASNEGDSSRRATVHLHLGVLYLSMAQYDSAISEFLMTLQLDDRKFMANYHLGLLYEAKSLKTNTEQEKLKLQKKALESWQAFVEKAEISKMKRSAGDKKKKKKKSKKRHSHRHACDTKYIDTAKKHIEFLKEELGNE